MLLKSQLRLGEIMSEFDTKSYLEKLDAWWRAANYISAAQMYLKDNPLLRRELVENDLKVHPIGHWGTLYLDKILSMLT